MDLDLPLDDPRREAFAQARARGLARKVAARAAGYTGKNTAKKLDGHEAVRARIGVILRQRAGGGSRDVGAVIDKLIALADQAAEAKEARGWDVARHCLVEAARLKGGLPADAAAPASAAAPRELTIEEWRARHDPPRPRPEPGAET